MPCIGHSMTECPGESVTTAVERDNSCRACQEPGDVLNCSLQSVAHCTSNSF